MQPTLIDDVTAQQVDSDEEEDEDDEEDWAWYSAADLTSRLNRSGLNSQVLIQMIECCYYVKPELGLIGS